MKIKKITAVLLSMVLLLSSTSCSQFFKLMPKPAKITTTSETEEIENSQTDSWENTGGYTEESSESSGQTEETSASSDEFLFENVKNKKDDRKVDQSKLVPLTYLDKIPTYEDIHPATTPGNVKGDEAVKLLNSIEKDYLAYVLDDYVDCKFYFEDYKKAGLNPTDYPWGDLPLYPDGGDSFYSETLTRLNTIDPEGLSDDDRLFYDKIKYDLELDVFNEKYSSFDYYTGKLDTLVGPQVEVMLLLDTFDFKTREDIKMYFEVLKDIDRYYDDLCYFEEIRAAYGFTYSRNQVSKIVQSFNNLVKMEDDCFLYKSFSQKIKAVDGLSSEDRNELVEYHEKLMKDVVFAEFKECADRLYDLSGTADNKIKCPISFKGGKEYYAYMFNVKTNSSDTIDHQIEVLDSVIKKDAANLKTFYSNYSGTGDMLSFADLVYINEDNSKAGARPTKGGIKNNLNYLRDSISADYPELPDHNYKLAEVPEALRYNFSPAAYLGYRLDTFDANTILVNGTTVPDGRICSHEGYPGHMYQSIYHRSRTSHPYMYVFGSIGYMEGWAEYSELYGLKYFDIDEGKLAQLRCMCELAGLLEARIDLGVNYESWNINSFRQYCSELGLENDTSSDTVAYSIMSHVATDPHYTTKYFMGYLNTGLTISEVRKAVPGKTDKELHTAYLNSLTGTFEQIKAHMIKELS